MVGDSQTEDIWAAGRCKISAIWINRRHEKLKEEIGKPLFIADDLKQVQHFLEKQ